MTVYDPLALVGAHQRSIVESLAKARADAGCIRQLLLGRIVRSTLRPDKDWKITEVRVNGAAIEVWGRFKGMATGKRLIARDTGQLTILKSDKEASSKEQASHEQEKPGRRL